MFFELNCQEKYVLPFTKQVLAICNGNLNPWMWDMYPSYMAIS